jgi:hypothetical protein
VGKTFDFHFSGQLKIEKVGLLKALVGLKVVTGAFRHPFAFLGSKDPILK